MEYLKELWTEHWILIVSVAILAVMFAGLFIVPYDVGWYAIPVIGTCSGLGLTIFGIYHSCAANYANTSLSLSPQKKPSYKAKLRDLRSQRRVAQRKAYGYKGYYSLQNEYINKLRRIEAEIAKETGMSDER